MPKIIDDNDDDLEIMEVPIEEDEKKDKDLFSILDKIEKKIDHSPVLNGGFEKLLIKIDYLVADQNELSSKVDKIHDSLFQPPEGLQYKLLELKTTTDFLKEQVKKDEENQTELIKSQQNITNSIQPILKTRRNLNKLLWIFVPIILSVFVKIAYSFIKGII